MQQIKVIPNLQRATFVEFLFFQLNKRSAKNLSFLQKSEQNLKTRASYFEKKGFLVKVNITARCHNPRSALTPWRTFPAKRPHPGALVTCCSLAFFLASTSRLSVSLLSLVYYSPHQGYGTRKKSREKSVDVEEIKARPQEEEQNRFSR